MATIYMGHASIDENGNASGGTAGDQTGKEVCKRTWYSKPWDYMAIYPDADIREKMASLMEDACANDNIGYDQNQRNTLHTKAKAASYKISSITSACECDCSSLINTICVAAGIGSYGSNGWTTSTMKSKLTALGFVIITSSTYLTSSAYCLRGAIYVKSASHTAMGLTNGDSYAKTLSKAGLSTTTTSSSSSSSSSSTTSKTATKSASKKDSSLAGTYKTTANLNMRNGAGTSYTSMVVLPKGTSVKNYGYYSLDSSGTKWLYVQVTYNSVKYTGFCSSKYLTKS